ncbi:WXG100 family type VII secretion target [Aspergillus puulaauensis]|uniref:WXG100 family type VII secretion target n=1 Tax=Aspergillus puulaauensis TaxID=1220207 RepID=A0A7R8AKB2_9EURO|nr:uncharacterized protein APUU_20765S [Aspergillus puulaauensis]BCS20333.1 hypothetical protein APUU_20765S [Aspergillus puulaauensis]
MHFSKILPVTLFAALAVAAPAPAPQISVDPEQIKQFSQSIQSFASNTDSGLNDLNGQREALGSSWNGQVAQALEQAFSQFEQAVNEITETASKISSALDGSVQSFDEAEESNAGRFD